MSFDLIINRQQYGQHVVLENIRQSYAPGLIHGILGANGSGKTTLFHCMASLIPFDGEKMISDEIKFGFLPAELFMYSMITGEEFLSFYVTAKKAEWDKRKLEETNKLFELPLGEYAENYSTGMMKKLYLMGLILQENELLLLDEPFNGLDFQSSAVVTALLVEYRNRGKSIFVASHDVEHLLGFADTISILKNRTMEFYPDRHSFDAIKQNILLEAQNKVKQLF